MALGVLQGGVLPLSKEGTVWFSRENPQGERIKELELDLRKLRGEHDELKRHFAQMEQEWDATVHRVTKVLRRLRSAQEAEETDVEATPEVLPETTLRPSSGRLDKIREQLAARGRKDGE